MAIEVDAVAYDSPTVEGGAVDLVAVEAGSFDVDTLIARATEGIEAATGVLFSFSNVFDSDELI